MCILSIYLFLMLSSVQDDSLGDVENAAAAGCRWPEGLMRFMKDHRKHTKVTKPQRFCTMSARASSNAIVASISFALLISAAGLESLPDPACAPLLSTFAVFLGLECLLSLLPLVFVTTLFKSREPRLSNPIFSFAGMIVSINIPCCAVEHSHSIRMLAFPS
jgi:hypothetical protein